MVFVYLAFFDVVYLFLINLNKQLLILSLNRFFLTSNSSSSSYSRQNFVLFFLLNSPQEYCKQSNLNIRFTWHEPCPTKRKKELYHRLVSNICISVWPSESPPAEGKMETSFRQNDEELRTQANPTDFKLKLSIVTVFFSYPRGRIFFCLGYVKVTLE